MIEWVISAGSILGAVLNALGNKWGFAVWVFTNLAWIVYDIYIGLWGQIPIWIAFTVTSFYGFWLWSKKPFIVTLKE